MKKNEMMKLVGAAALAAAVAAQAAMVTPNPKSNLKNMKVLVVTGGSGHGEPKANTLNNLKAMATTYGFTLKPDGDPKNLTDAFLKDYNIVIFNYFFQSQDNTIFPQASKDAFQRWLEGGGNRGYIGYHTSGANEWAKDEWKWYQENVTGMRYALHGSGTPQGNVEITKDASILALPIMQGLTPSFSATDEWYEYETTSKLFDASLGYKLMYFLTNTSAITRSPAAPNHPVAWFREAPNGTKYFYSTFIHTGDGANQDWFKSILLRAMEWEAGYSDAIVTQNGKDVLTNKNLSYVTNDRTLRVELDGAYRLSVWSPAGKQLYSVDGQGKMTYSPAVLKKAGLYVVKVEAKSQALTQKIMVY